MLLCYIATIAESLAAQRSKVKSKKRRCTLPETNIFAPENGWLEYDRFLLGCLGLFSGANWLFVLGSVPSSKNYGGFGGFAAGLYHGTFFFELLNITLEYCPTCPTYLFRIFFFTARTDLLILRAKSRENSSKIWKKMANSKALNQPGTFQALKSVLKTGLAVSQAISSECFEVIYTCGSFFPCPLEMMDSS